MGATREAHDLVYGTEDQTHMKRRMVEWHALAHQFEIR